MTVVQNGEIYNYVELRAELARWRARVRDRRPIPKSSPRCTPQIGDAAFERMRGMFAIAIWDAPRRRLVLARDRVGKKPLYYMQAGDRFLFALRAEGDPRRLAARARRLDGPRCSSS